DRVDFFYNQSAPLTNYFWHHDLTLRRVTRVIRTTQPEVFIGWTPTLHAGHGNHQEAGRLIWEGVQAASDPSMFPDQLRGPHSLSTWQVKKIFSGYPPPQGTGGSTTQPNCTTGFKPSNLDTVAGVWTGYDSPYTWPAGNTSGIAAGTPKIWQQVAAEGRSAYPTQSRVMYQDVAEPACPRFVMTDSFVPFQPNTRADGSVNPLAGNDQALLYGAQVKDPGGLPLGTLEYLTFSSFYNVPGVAFQATVHLKSGSHRLRGGTVRLTVPPGWTTDGPKRVRHISTRRESTVTFTVTPSPSASVEQNAKISATLTAGGMTGHTDNIVRVVPPVEGRYHRWGKWAEYDSWLKDTAPAARRLGRSDAVASMGVGETTSIGVDVHNWSDASQTGEVSLDLPADLTADSSAVAYGPLAPGATTTVHFTVTNTDTSLPAEPLVSVPITTTSDHPESSGSETLSLSLVPNTAVPEASAKPTVDAQASPGEYDGPKLDIGRIWQGGSRCTGTADCGVSGTGDPDSSYGLVSWYDDALYF
ncbi:MAG: NEW3 domain-containing protein, partial [Nocardioidaceae bacterium]